MTVRYLEGDRCVEVNQQFDRARWHIKQIVIVRQHRAVYRDIQSVVYYMFLFELDYMRHIIEVESFVSNLKFAKYRTRAEKDKGNNEYAAGDAHLLRPARAVNNDPVPCIV